MPASGQKQGDTVAAATREASALSLTSDGNPQDNLVKLLKLSGSLLSTRELDKLLKLVVRAFLQATEADRAFLLLVQADGTLKATAGENKAGDALSAGEPRISSLAAQVQSSGTPVYSTNLDHDGALASRASISELGLHMVVCVPLRGPLGTVGVIYADGKSTLDTVFTTANRNMLEALADHAGTAIDNARIFEGAIRDPVTALFNLGYFQLKVGELCEGKAPLAGACGYVAIIDLDETHAIAARLGPLAADDVLRSIANSLRAQFPAPDLTARVSPTALAVSFAADSDHDARARLERLVASHRSVSVPSVSDPVVLRLAVGAAPLQRRADTTITAAHNAARLARDKPNGVSLARG